MKRPEFDGFIENGSLDRSIQIARHSSYSKLEKLLTLKEMPSPEKCLPIDEFISTSYVPDFMEPVLDYELGVNKDTDKKTKALFRSISLGYNNLAKQLIENGADFKAYDNCMCQDSFHIFRHYSGTSCSMPADEAHIRRNFVVLKVLIDLGASYPYLHRHGDSADSDVFRFYLHHGVSVRNYSDYDVKNKAENMLISIEEAKRRFEYLDPLIMGDTSIIPFYDRSTERVRKHLT